MEPDSSFDRKVSAGATGPVMVDGKLTGVAYSGYYALSRNTILVKGRENIFWVSRKSNWRTSLR